MKIKLPSASIRKIIKPAFVNEIVALTTGETDFETTKFEQCEQITIPPLIRDWINFKWFDQTPQEVRANMRKHFQGISDFSRTPGGGMFSGLAAKSDEEKVVLINSVFSDDVIKNISFLLNQFVNVSSIPAVFCKFLQMAIDEIEEILKLTTDFEKEDEDKVTDVSAYINLHMKTSIEAGCSGFEQSNIDVFLNNKSEKRQMNFKHNSIRTPVGSDNYLAYSLLHWISPLLREISNIPTLKSPLTASDNAVQDDNMTDTLKESYILYIKFKKEIDDELSRLTANTSVSDIFNLISVIHEKTFIDSLTFAGSAAADFNTILNNTSTIEKIEREYNLLDDINKKKKKLGIMKSYFVMMNYLYGLSLQELLVYIPSTHGQPSYDNYYKNFPKFKQYLISVSTQILR